MSLNPMDYTLNMGDADVNANCQITVLGKEWKKPEKILLPWLHVICGTCYLEVFKIFQGKIWRILEESWAEFNFIIQIYLFVGTVVMPMTEMDTGQTPCVTTIWAQGSDMRWKIARDLDKCVVE